MPNNTKQTLQPPSPPSRYHTGADNHMIWLGDFNRHHPLWEDHTNQCLFTPEGFIQPLLNLLRDYDMDLALPPNIPTLETSAGNWT
jgi:hypothetical protein